MLLSPAIMGHREGAVMLAYFFNMSKKLAKFEIYQIGSMLDCCRLADSLILGNV